MNGYSDGALANIYVKNIRKCLEKSLRIRKYNNLVEALNVSKFLGKLFGVTVYDLVIIDDCIRTKFSLLGFAFYLLWYSLYFYCSYIAHINDQTILRKMYDTKVQRYGDDFERITSLAYVALAMWKVPFGLNGSSNVLQIILKADKIFGDLGESVDHNRDAYSASAIAFGQMVVYLIRLLLIWLILRHLDAEIPVERTYQVVFSDTLVLIVTALYCYILIVLRGRFRYVNKVLGEISSNKSWEYKIFVRGNLPVNVQKAEELQYKYICQKIRSCAKIYGLLYKAVIAMNDLFGLILVITIFVCLIYVILYLFYFMEATAAGLFHDLPKYIDFFIYVFLQATYAVAILYVIVIFCETVMREAAETSYIVHGIINNDLTPSVTSEAMQLSLQLVHQRPIFTAYGLYKLNYALFEQVVQSASDIKGQISYPNLKELLK